MIQCAICEQEFKLVESMIRTRTKRNGQIIECRIECPYCLKVFDFVGDPTPFKEEEGRLANMRSTIKPAVKGKRSFPRTLIALPKEKMSQDWYDYCGPHLDNLAREVDYFDNLTRERPLTKAEFEEYLRWREMLDEALEKRAGAELRLRESGQLGDEDDNL